MNADPLSPVAIRELLEALVGIPSVNPTIAPGEAHAEGAVATFACEWLDARGVRACARVVEGGEQPCFALEPDTALTNPEVMRRVAKGHDGTAGVYAAVLVEGVVRAGDAIALID